MGVNELTPAMRQYRQIKELYPDCILFFRMGDFYEMFFEDAIVASKILEITLTSRNKSSSEAIPLCGVPYHAGSSYIAKLIDRGYKVAVCEQMEDPKTAKGVVKREVVRVVTPGLVLDPESLPAKENNYLAALAVRGEAYGLAIVDISTGEFQVIECKGREAFLAETAGLQIRELLIPEGMIDEGVISSLSRGGERCLVTRLPLERFDASVSQSLLRQQFTAEELKSVFEETNSVSAVAAGAALAYIGETQKGTLSHINKLSLFVGAGCLILDETAKRNLELFTTIVEGKKSGSLFHVLDQTVTSLGARRLRRWLSYPLADPARIRSRLQAVGELKSDHLLRGKLREILQSVYDLERLGSRIAVGLANARDLAALRSSLQALPLLRSAIAGCQAELIRGIYAAVDELPVIRELLEVAIVDDPPVTVREGGMIRKGFDHELDELMSAADDGMKWIAAMEAKERQRTGISSLKIGYNNVFGYYIEVTKANSSLVPADYIRKQTLVNAERYINEELKGYEDKVLHARERRIAREYDLFVQIRTAVAKEIRKIQDTAGHIGDLDALISLAEAAELYNYTCPVVDDEEIIEIVDGRHPVVEWIPSQTGFVPNDTLLDMDHNRLLIITGPNMAGKSTYIRQVALIVLMAQMGSFVPAKRARIGVVDRIFTRIGSADSLSKGQSTFMVEMMEVAEILRHATPRSLIILDEVGRGTSTFDGLSIAWAVAEYIHDKGHLGARTLFATHYHELTELAVTNQGVKNFNIAVREWGDKIIFLRKIMEGGTNRSYGIQVAGIAGVPEEVIVRAKEILRNMEQGELDQAGRPRLARGKTESPAEQLSLFKDAETEVIEEIRQLDIMNLTPLEALRCLADWQERLKYEQR